MYSTKTRTVAGGSTNGRGQTSTSGVCRPKIRAIGKEGIAAFASGDVDTWMKSFADNANYYWSSGDSLIGKKAISDYWTERRGKVIDKMVISKDIWFAIKINQSQRGPDAPGVWLMSWYQVEPTYKMELD